MNNKILKTLGATALLSSFAGTAAADVVIAETETTKISMFGILDVGLLYQSNPSIEGEENLTMETSGLRQSVFGFKGNRQLDGSTSAFFNLEAHFDVDSGMLHGSGDAAGEADDSSGTLLFRRQANIGLTGDWGTVIAGRQYGPALLAHLGTEPRVFKEQFSNLYSWAYSQLFSTVNPSDSEAGRNTNNDVGIFFKNAIQYRNNISGIDFGILYSFGGQEGSSKNGDVIAVGASYGTGPVTLSGSYQIMSDQDTGEDVVESFGIGAAYKIGAIDLKVNFLNTENHDSLGNEILDVDALGLGVDYKWSEKNTMTVAYYINEDNAAADDATTKSFVVSNEFTLGDSTTLYTAIAYVDADEMSTISQYATSIVAAPAPVGEKTTLVNVGVNFAF
ncbi:porin [Colwellia sp. E150_009]|jgi:predicted porin